MSKYIDESGLNYLWGKVKAYVSGLGFYTKPSTGIPASDIASGVIPTVPTALSSFTDDLGSSPTHTHSQYLTSHQDISGKANSADLATVATSGSYTDLVDAPQYIICTLAQYNAMASHDSDTYYIIISDNA